MDYSKIIVVTGKSGLFKVLSQTRTGFIAESLIEDKKIPISANNKITTLQDIVIFTEGEDIKLTEVLKKMYIVTEGKQGIDHKSDDAAIRKFFESVLPEYDKDRVYVSDMRKMISWFNLLLSKNMLEFTEESIGDAPEEQIEHAESEEKTDIPDES